MCAWPTRPFCIGPAAARESYLDIDADHRRRAQDGATRDPSRVRLPVRERATLLRPAERAGIVFIGPPAAAIRAMGSKIGAKRLDGKRRACRWCRAIRATIRISKRCETAAEASAIRS